MSTTTDRRERFHRDTAQQLLSRPQAVALVVVVLVVAGLVLAPRPTLIALVTAATAFYVLFVGLKLALHVAAGRHRPPASAPVTVDDPDLPRYTVLVPLHEEANVLPHWWEIVVVPEQLPAGAEGVGGWDPWNVTEDAELAGALAAHRCRVQMIDSVTREEATATLAVADKQRRRCSRATCRPAWSTPAAL